MEKDDENLNLEKRGLTKIPLDLLHPVSGTLTHLNLSNNNLDTITSEISILKNLKHLLLSNNRLFALPESLTELPLNTLSLSSNCFGDENIKSVRWIRLTNLQELYLCGNQLTKFPSSITGLLRLKMLSLAGNNIESFNTDDLNSMLSLKVLSISDNPLGYECAKSLEKAANIKQISIYGCTLTPSEDMRIVTRLRNNANSILTSTYETEPQKEEFFAHSSGLSLIPNCPKLSEEILQQIGIQSDETFKFNKMPDDIAPPLKLENSQGSDAAATQTDNLSASTSGNPAHDTTVETDPRKSHNSSYVERDLDSFDKVPSPPPPIAD